MTHRPRVFTLQEANGLLPRLNVLLEQQIALVSELDELTAALVDRGYPPQAFDAAEGDAPAVVALKTQARDRVERLRACCREVEATGAVIKDVRTGLVDFHGRVQGQLVWLCWRYGEPAVAHWHPLDEGFSQRRPLPRESIPPTMN